MAAARWAMGTTSRWPPRKNSKEAIQARRLRTYFGYTVAFTFLLLLLILGLRHPASSQFFSGSRSLSSFFSSSVSAACRQCSSTPPASVQMLPSGEKFMWYAPHSGFSNQLIELKNALKFASLLNRTLILPPVLDHHALSLGSCPKSRLLHTADQLRALAWNEFSALIRDSRIETTGLCFLATQITKELNKTIGCVGNATVQRTRLEANKAKDSNKHPQCLHRDLSHNGCTNVHQSVWVDGVVIPERYVSIADIVDLSAITPELVRTIDLRAFAAMWCGVDIKPACYGPWCKRLAKRAGPAWGSMEVCGALLSQSSPQPQCCVYGVQDDCTTTLWTYEAKQDSPAQEESTAGRFLQESSKGGKKKKKAKAKDVVATLGHGSAAAEAVVLSFGSLFSMEYKQVQTHINIAALSGSKKLDKLLKASKHLPFATDIVEAGRTYVQEFISQPFFCAQLRLLDGQFKKQWEKIFAQLETKLERLHRDSSTQKIALFVMTDLPREDWQGTYLGRLASNHTHYKVRTLSAKKALVTSAARNIIVKERGLRSGYLPKKLGSVKEEGKRKPKFVPDVLLNIEEVVCSFASLGFSGTSGSTLTDTITEMRAADEG